MIDDFKVMTIVGTRPELIKLSLVIKELDASVQHTLVHTGQNFDYELNQIFFEELEIRKPDYFLEAVGQTTAQTIGNVIAKSDELFEKEQPDAVLFYGDTNSCLAVISAKRRKIPVFHLEAGNRCFDQRVPEELNRKVVDHLSDINVVHSEHARRYLLNEGLSPDQVFKFGSPMDEILERYSSKIEKSDALKNLKLERGKYFLVSSHREENIDLEVNFNELLKSLDSLAQEYKQRIIVSTHPRTRKKLEKMNYQSKNELVEFMKPLGFFDYVALQKNARCVLSDSGTITEESSILGFPAVMIRQAHERPEGMDQTSVIMSDLKYKSLIRAVRLATESSFVSSQIEDYGNKNFSKQIVRLILSYTDFVNRVVWRKN